MSSDSRVGHEEWMPILKSKTDNTSLDSRAARPEALQQTGRRLVIAGFVITIVGIVAYCAVTFVGGMDAEMGDMLLRNTVPFTRATLGLLGLGTLVWLVGSFTYLRGAMDADDDGPIAR